MAWETPGAPAPTLDSNAQILAEESTRVFMARVYRWMFAGLAITGATAYGVASTPALLEIVLPLVWPIMIVNLISVFIFRLVAHKASAPVAATIFVSYSFGTGLWMSLIFIVFTLGSIYTAFAISAGLFAAMSIYGTVTKKNLSAWSAFLFMGLVGVMIAILVNIFLGSAGLDFIINCACVVIFAGLTAYHTQKLREFHASSGYSSSGALAINGALALYLDFINLFLRILLILGRRR